MIVIIVLIIGWMYDRFVNKTHVCTITFDLKDGEITHSFILDVYCSEYGGYHVDYKFSSGFNEPKLQYEKGREKRIRLKTEKFVKGICKRISKCTNEYEVIKIINTCNRKYGANNNMFKIEE